MSVLIATLTSFRAQLASEFERFTLLWRYQHPVPPFTLWWRLVLKRAVDLVGTVCALVVFGPIMALVALAIKLDSRGPVIYCQERVGRFGETFRIYKFRSMHVDAEANGPVWCAGEQDSRLTRIGGFLRRSHLDELPQLFNVWRGDMSLVGPRPERPVFVRELDTQVANYEDRHLIKPGMTGLAQVHYRYDQTVTDVRRKLRFDLLYIRRMCLMLDAKILAWTVMLCITGRAVR